MIKPKAKSAADVLRRVKGSTPASVNGSVRKTKTSERRPMWLSPESDIRRKTK